MDIDSDAVQEFVDELVEEYENKTILGDNKYVNNSGSPASGYEECRCDLEVAIEDTNQFLQRPMRTGSIVNNITSCEKQKFIRELDVESDSVVQIGDDIQGNMVKKVGNFRTPQQIFLPDDLMYHKEVNKEAIGKVFRIESKDLFTFFDTSIFESKGFVIGNGVYVHQKKQDQTPVVNANLRTKPLPKDNTENTLKVNFSRNRSKIMMGFYTEFTLPQKRDTSEELIRTIELPKFED